MVAAAITLRFPKSIVERLRKEAERLGLSLEGYIIELITQGLDPRDRAVEYIEVAKELLEEAREELEGGNIRRAAEKVWGAAALTVKAYAMWRDRKGLASHGELWLYSKRIMEEFGEWVYDAWMAANGMHTCFYEGWCIKEHVEHALKRVRRLVEEVANKVMS